MWTSVKASQKVERFTFASPEIFLPTYVIFVDAGRVVEYRYIKSMELIWVDTNVAEVNKRKNRHRWTIKHKNELRKQPTLIQNINPPNTPDCTQMIKTKLLVKTPFSINLNYKSHNILKNKKYALNKIMKLFLSCRFSRIKKC